VSLSSLFSPEVLALLSKTGSPNFCPTKLGVAIRQIPN